MLGHIAVPALDPTGAPATLSAAHGDRPAAARASASSGLIVTDAMEMQGVRAAWTGEAAVRAVQAGADFILLPPDPDVAIQALVRAVREGRAHRGAHRRRPCCASWRRRSGSASTASASSIPPPSGGGGSARRTSRARIDVARRSITVLRNEGGVLPLRAEQPLRILHLVLSSDARNDADRRASRRTSWRRGASRRRRSSLGPEVSADTAQRRSWPLASGVTHVLASAFVRVGAYKGTADMAESHARLLRGAGRRRGGRWSWSPSAAPTCCGRSRRRRLRLRLRRAPIRASARRSARCSASIL